MIELSNGEIKIAVVGDMEYVAKKQNVKVGDLILDDGGVYTADLWDADEAKYVVTHSKRI